MNIQALIIYFNSWAAILHVYREARKAANLIANVNQLVDSLFNIDNSTQYAIHSIILVNN